nr:hypothetical protein [Chromohalobacter salexigens]
MTLKFAAILELRSGRETVDFPQKSGHAPSVQLLKFQRRPVTKAAVEPLGIIKDFNIAIYMFPQLPHRHETGGMQQFSLQRLEERLNLGVVRALARAVHAVTSPMLF